MIKWFFIYKWLEFKEFMQEHWIPVFAAGTFIVSALLWSIPLSHADQNPFEIVTLSILLGIVTTVALAVVLALVIQVKRIVKNNIEKARTAAGYVEHDLRCVNCHGMVKLTAPVNSWSEPWYKCKSCGEERSVERAVKV